MNKLQHKIYISFFVLVTIAILFMLIHTGYGYYTTPLDKRFFSPEHNNLKPSGLWAHGYGIIGTILMVLGVGIYMVRKRVKRFARFGALKYWLEFHIFLCTVGPILILFHTAFKFGGIVSISFWSMVLVFLSGIIGRFIYIRIPHTIEGEELNIEQINETNENLSLKLKNEYSVDEDILESIEDFYANKDSVSDSLPNFFKSLIPNFLENRKKIKKINKRLTVIKIPKQRKKEVLKIIKEKISINNKITYLKTMQNLFRYWHVIHLPFAIIMIIIMVVHVIVTVTFGYRWIF